MRVDIPSPLVTAMALPHFDPAVAVYTQPHLPVWSEVSQVGDPPENPIGHDAKYVNEHLLRVRSGSLADPDNGFLYFADITGADLDSPATWEDLWVRVGAIANVVPPNWMADPPTAQPGQVAVAADDAGNVRLFYFNTSLKLLCAESDDWGATWDVVDYYIYNVTLSNLALQVAACELDEVYFTNHVLITPKPSGAPNLDVYGTTLYRSKLSGSVWTTTTSWPLRGRWWFEKSSRSTTIWGDPVWAGLAAVKRPDGRVLIATGALLLDALSEGGSQQGVFTFIYDQVANLWWPGATVSIADYNDEEWYFDLEVRASLVNGQVWLSWAYEDEPTDVRQSESWAIVPRTREIVYSRSLTGDHFTELECITTNSRAVGSGPVVLVGNKLYMVSWFHIYQADATYTVLGDDAVRTDIGDLVDFWAVQQTGRNPDMQISLGVKDPANFVANPGDLVTVEAGAIVDGTPELVQVAQGFLDSFDPTISVQEARYEGPVSALVAKPLLDVRSRSNVDLFPQETTLVEPRDMGQIAIETGAWEIKYNPAWAVSAGLGSRNFVETNTYDGEGGATHQVALLTHPRTLNGQIEAAVRMGCQDLWHYNSTYQGTYGGWYIEVNFVNGYHKQYRLKYGSGGAWTTWARADWMAAGLVARAYSGERCYVFVWEPGLADFASRLIGTGDEIHANGHTLLDNALVLYVVDFAASEGGGNTYWSVLEIMNTHGMTVGEIAHLKMVCHYGQIHCYYRSHADATWHLAFSHTAGATFGAGRFGVYGRGMGPPEPPFPSAYRNRSWLWDLQVASEDRTITIEDVVKDFAWRAGIETDTDASIDDASRSPAGTYMYSAGAYDPVMDANITLAAGESGFVLRATDADNGIFLGITPGAIGTGKLSLRVKVGGAVTATVSSPTWFTVPTAVSLPVRVCASGHWYSCWIGNLLLGSIYYYYQGGAAVGVFGDGAFANVRMPELYEVPAFATLDSNQAILEAITGFLAKRRIRRFVTWDGKLRLGYFFTRDMTADNDNRMIQNAMRMTDRYISHCRVNGARGWAEYKSESLLVAKGRHFREVDMPDIEGRETMYLEARAVVREAAELARQDNFSGYPDLTLEPEDQVRIIVDAQSLDGDFVIDDVAVSFRDGKITQDIGTRQVYVE